MSLQIRGRSRAAALLAVAFGLLLLLMGGGHVLAVTDLARAEGRPFDFRLVSMITLGGLVALPGVLSLALVPWLWRARPWASAMVVAATTCLLGYLLLLQRMEKSDPPTVGGELDVAIVVVLLYAVAHAGLGLRHAKAARLGDAGDRLSDDPGPADPPVSLLHSAGSARR